MEGTSIVIKAKTLTDILKDRQPVVRLTRDAYRILVDLTSESGVPIGKIASEIIRQGSELVVFDRGEGGTL